MSEIIHKARHSILLENIKNIYRKISSAAIRSGRSPFDVQLVAVTKTVSMDKIQEAVDLGLRLFGENRVQEAQKKIEFRRVIRVSRMLSEMRYGSIFDALEDLKKYRDKYGAFKRGSKNGTKKEEFNNDSG